MLLSSITVKVKTKQSSNTKNDKHSKKKNFNKNLKCIYTNARIIINKFTNLETIAAEAEPDIVRITES